MSLSLLRLALLKNYLAVSKTHRSPLRTVQRTWVSLPVTPLHSPNPRDDHPTLAILRRTHRVSRHTIPRSAVRSKPSYSWQRLWTSERETPCLVPPSRLPCRSCSKVTSAGWLCVFTSGGACGCRCGVHAGPGEGGVRCGTSGCGAARGLWPEGEKFVRGLGDSHGGGRVGRSGVYAGADKCRSRRRLSLDGPVVLATLVLAYELLPARWT